MLGYELRIFRDVSLIEVAFDFLQRFFAGYDVVTEEPHQILRQVALNFAQCRVWRFGNSKNTIKRLLADLSNLLVIRIKQLGF